MKNLVTSSFSTTKKLVSLHSRSKCIACQVVDAIVKSMLEYFFIIFISLLTFNLCFYYFFLVNYFKAAPVKDIRHNIVGNKKYYTNDRRSSVLCGDLIRIRHEKGCTDHRYIIIYSNNYIFICGKDAPENENSALNVRLYELDACRRPNI